MNPAGDGAGCRLQQLEQEIQRLRRIRDALIHHVESGSARVPAPYAAFEHSVVLAEQVRERTEALNHALEDLRESNQALEQARREAEQANHSKSRFLAAVSHDLLQPLNAARLFTSSLQSEALPERARQLTNSLSASLEAVDHLLGTLVDISRLDAGVITPDLSDFDLTELTDALAHEFRELAAAQSLVFRYRPAAVTVRSDSRLLARILRNIVSNALRYTGGGGVLLACRAGRDCVHLQVWDTGPGIDPAMLDDIFREFHRAGVTGDRQDRGLGLGLAIVDRIARLLDHPVRVASRVGRGTVFSVTVPRV